MVLTVKELELGKIHFDVSFDPDKLEYFDPGLRQVSPLKTTGYAELVENTPGEVRVQGHLRVDMEVQCDRCMESALKPIDSDFDLYYRPAAAANPRHPAEEVQLDEGEIDLAFYEGTGLDLQDILREHILLSMPMQRVCSPGCLGICPACGQNRNLTLCKCQAKPLDDRWASLKNLNTRGI